MAIIKGMITRRRAVVAVAWAILVYAGSQELVMTAAMHVTATSAQHSVGAPVPAGSSGSG